MGFYEKFWKPLTLASLIILLFSVVIIAGNLASTGFVMDRDVELTGGKRVSFIVEDATLEKAEGLFAEYDVKLYSGTTDNLVISMPYEANETGVIEKASSEFTVIGQPTVESIGPAIGEVFWQKAQMALVFSLLLMAIMVFLLFRSAVPSLIVMFSAITDMLGTVAVASLLGVELSFGVLAALIMIVAYSVDTDVLLTSSMLKYKNKDIRDIMKTGLTMSATTFAALLALYILTGSGILQTMALVIMIGILIDVPVTWLTNAGLLRMWVEKHE